MIIRIEILLDKGQLREGQIKQIDEEIRFDIAGNLSSMQRSKMNQTLDYEITSEIIND